VSPDHRDARDRPQCQHRTDAYREWRVVMGGLVCSEDLGQVCPLGEEDDQEDGDDDEGHGDLSRRAEGTSFAPAMTNWLERRSRPPARRSDDPGSVEPVCRSSIGGYFPSVATLLDAVSTDSCRLGSPFAWTPNLGGRMIG
jgi:hypothetical protein